MSKLLAGLIGKYPRGDYPLWKPSSLSQSSNPITGLSPPCRRRPWWPAVSGREVWFSVAVGFVLFSFSQANKEAAGSRFTSAFLQSSLTLAQGVEEERWSGVGGGSHASTSRPNPWRGLSSADLAPPIPTPSCCNKISCRLLDGSQDPRLVSSRRGDVEEGLLHVVCDLADLQQMASINLRDSMPTKRPKPCLKSMSLIGCADGHTLSSMASSFDAFQAALKCLNSNQFAADESKENLKKLQALFFDASMLHSDGEAMCKILINSTKEWSAIQLILYLHTRVGCSTCGAAQGSRFFAQFTKMMPTRWRPSGVVGCNLLKLAGEDVGLLIWFCFGLMPVLLQIKWHNRALRFMNANELPKLQMDQTSCYTLDLLQADDHAAYSIFVPLELIS